jgi:protein TonB
VVIGLVVMSCLIQAQDKKAKGYSVDSTSVIDPGAGGGFIEQMPNFPGGEEKLLKFISKNLIYPENAKKEKIEGRVICRFIVNRDGSVSDIKVVRSLDTSCDTEAIKVLKLLPKFIPGKQNGKNVRVWYTIPITFKLE